MLTLRVKSLTTARRVVDHLHITLIVHVTVFTLNVALFIPRLYTKRAIGRFESVRVRAIVIQRVDLLQNGNVRRSRCFDVV